MLIPTTPEALELQRVRSILSCIHQQQTEAQRRRRMGDAVSCSVFSKLLQRQLNR